MTPVSRRRGSVSGRAGHDGAGKPHSTSAMMASVESDGGNVGGCSDDMSADAGKSIVVWTDDGIQLASDVDDDDDDDDDNDDDNDGDDDDDDDDDDVISIDGPGVNSISSIFLLVVRTLSL